jgi:hypothetical protein
VYDACEDEITLRPLATYLGIKRVHCTRPTQRVWNALKSLVKLVRSEVCMWIFQRRRPDAHVEYTYYPQCQAESIRMQDARDYAAIVAARPRIVEVSVPAQPKTPEKVKIADGTPCSMHAYGCTLHATESVHFTPINRPEQTRELCDLHRRWSIQSLDSAAERSRLADMKARDAQLNSTPSMSIVHAQ